MSVRGVEMNKNYVANTYSNTKLEFEKNNQSNALQNKNKAKQKQSKTKKDSNTIK